MKLKEKLMNGNTKWIMAIIGLFILIATGIGSYSIVRVDNIDSCLRTEYVQKADYKADIKEIKEGMKALNHKMDTYLTNRNN
jgi:uncharacterized membrane protein